MSLSNSLPSNVSKSKDKELGLLRWALVIVFVWIGGMKFTAYEADGIAPLIKFSPIMSWLHQVFSVQGASNFVGTMELITALALTVGARNRLFAIIGATMSSATFATTLTFMLSTPGVFEPTAGGFPALSAMPGQFLLKDVVLLAASLVLLFNALHRRK